MPDPVLRDDRFSRPCQAFGQPAPHVLPVLGVDQLEGIAADQLAVAKADEARGRGAGIHDPAVGIDQRDAIVAVLEQRSKPRFAGAERFFYMRGCDWIL